MVYDYMAAMSKISRKYKPNCLVDQSKERDENEIKERYTGVFIVSIMFMIFIFLHLKLFHNKQIGEEIQMSVIQLGLRAKIKCFSKFNMHLNPQGILLKC